jgi:hypothetical protein
VVLEDLDLVAVYPRLSAHAGSNPRDFGPPGSGLRDWRENRPVSSGNGRKAK